MHGRRPALVAAALAVIALMAIGGLTFVVFEQRAANRQVVGELDRLRVSIDQQVNTARGLSNQVETLSARVVELERDNKELRRRLATPQRRRPAEMASSEVPVPATLPAPLESTSRPDYVEHAAIESSSFAKATADKPAALVETLPITWATDWAEYQPAGIVGPPPQAAVSRKLTDPAFVKTMYATFASLQAADIVTTTRALDRGGREANPFARSYVNSPPKMIAVKAGVTVATVLITERLRKEHPVTASVMLIALNATLAAVVINNANVNFDR